MSSNLDRLLHLVGVLGADAAWLLRGAAHVVLDYDDVDDVNTSLAISEEFGPAVLIVRFPDDGSEEYGVAEMRLPPGASDREIQAATLLNIALDNLTRIGPHTTLRVLRWVFERYGIKPAAYDSLWAIRDRRPKESRPDPPAAPVVEPAPELVAELDPWIERGRDLRRQRVALGLTQRELTSRIDVGDRADMSIVSQSLISRIERGVVEADDALWDAIEAALAERRKEEAG